MQAKLILLTAIKQMGTWSWRPSLTSKVFLLSRVVSKNPGQEQVDWHFGRQIVRSKDTEQPLDLRSTDTERTHQVTEKVKILFGKYWNHCKNYLELCNADQWELDYRVMTNEKPRN